MSIFKVPKSVLNYMESLRRNFFNGIQEGDRKIAWVKWSKVLASLRNSEGWESLVSSLSIGLFFLSGYGATFLMITPYGPEFIDGGIWMFILMSRTKIGSLGSNLSV
ncbi:hypothetical protein Tco_1157898 [Tanacetum coccineum]